MTGGTGKAEKRSCHIEHKFLEEGGGGQVITLQLGKETTLGQHTSIVVTTL